MPFEPVDGFFRYQLAVGTVLTAEVNAKAKKPAYHLVIDFGPWGTKHTSAQLTRHYMPEDLVGTQVVAVLNFPPRRIADVTSEVLVLGAVQDEGRDVILLRPDHPVPNGTLIS